MELESSFSVSGLEDKYDLVVFIPFAIAFRNNSCSPMWSLRSCCTPINVTPSQLNELLLFNAGIPKKQRGESEQFPLNWEARSCLARYCDVSFGK